MNRDKAMVTRRTTEGPKRREVSGSTERTVDAGIDVSRRRRRWVDSIRSPVIADADGMQAARRSNALKHAANAARGALTPRRIYHRSFIFFQSTYTH